jgi:hypothetical protein
VVKKIGKGIKQGVRRDREKKEAIAVVAVGTRKTEPRFHHNALPNLKTMKTRIKKSLIEGSGRDSEDLQH